jgi:hypothetical protein
MRTHGAHGLLATALAYEAAADELSFVAGPALVGALASAGSLVPAAVTMVLIAAATLPFALLHTHRTSSRPVGVRVMPRLPRRPLTVMFLAMAATGAVFGSVQTAVTVYAETTGRPGAAGLVYAEFGIGSALAGAACAWLPLQFSLRARYVCFAAALFVAMPALYVGARTVSLPVAAVPAGLAVAPYMISLYALTEQLAPTERAGVAMTVLCAGGPLGTAAAQAASGRLAEAHGLTGALLVAPVAACGALVLALSASFAGRGLLPDPSPRPDA